MTIPEGVTAIEQNAFGDCRNLREVTIPASVTAIDRSAFTYDPGQPGLFIMEGFTIHAPAGSFAERYAWANNIPFEAMGE